MTAPTDAPVVNNFIQPEISAPIREEEVKNGPESSSSLGNQKNITV